MSFDADFFLANKGVEIFTLIRMKCIFIQYVAKCR